MGRFIKPVWRRKLAVFLMLVLVFSLLPAAGSARAVGEIYGTISTSEGDLESSTTGDLTIYKNVVGGGDEAANKTYTFTVTGPEGPNSKSHPATVTGSDSTTLNGLEPGTYTVAEQDADIDGWDLDVTGGGNVTVVAGKETTATVTNTYTELGKLTIKKVVSGGDADALSKVYTFDVTGPDGYTNTATVTGSDSTTLNGLEPGTYTVTEQNADIAGWTLDVTGGGTVTVEAGGTAETTVTNTYTRKTGGLTVTKRVAGSAGETDREWNFTVALDDSTISGTYGNMTFENGQAAFTLKDGESKTASGLPAGVGYTVTETDANTDGYTTSWTGETSGTIPADGTASAECTNTRDIVSSTTGNLIVTKTVTGSAGDTNKEFNFTVTLTGDVEVKNDTYGDMTFTNGVATFTLKHNESKTATGLPAGITYTVTEEEANQDGYTTTSDGATGTIPDEDNTVKAEFTNSKNPPPPSRPTTGSLTVTKTVSGGGDAAKDKTFTFTVTGPDNYSKTVTVKGGGSRTLYGLTPGEYTVTEDKDGAAIDGWTLEVTGGGNVTVEAGKTAKAAVTNTYTEEKTGSLTLTKTVAGGGDAAAAMKYTFTVTGPDGYEKTVTITGAGSETLTGLVPGEYRIEEADAAIDGWTLEVTGGGNVTVEAGKTVEAAVINTYTEEKTGSLTLTKAIVGGGDAAAAKTYTFTVTGPNGYEKTVTVTGAGSETLTGLVPGEYTVTEADASISGYTLAVTGGGNVTVEAGKTAAAAVTNTYTEEKTGSLTLTKAIVGGGDAAAARTYTFTVTGPENYSKTVTVTGAGSETLTGLVPGEYTVTEADASISGYTLAVTGGGNVTVEAGKTAAATVTNTYTERNSGGLTVTKLVDGATGDRSAEFHFTVALADMSVNGTYGGMTFTNGVASFTLKHGESVSAEGLPSGVGYTVTEDEADQYGYVTTSTGETGTIPAKGMAQAWFRNNKGNTTPGTGRLVVRKAVSGDGAETDRDFHFTVQLSDVSVSGTYGEMTFTGGTAEFTLRDGENKWARNLPVGISYTVTEIEADQDGYTTKVTGGSGIISVSSYGVWAEARFLNTTSPEEPDEPFEELDDPDIPLSDFPGFPGGPGVPTVPGYPNIPDWSAPGVPATVPETPAVTTEIPAENPETPELDDIPKTGDDSRTGLWTALAALALTGLVLTAALPISGRVTRRRDRNGKQR